MEITKEYFDNSFNGLNTSLSTKISALEASNTGIKAAVNKMATQESLDELRFKVDDIDKTLGKHSKILESMVVDEKEIDDNKTADSHRLDVAEKHIDQLAKHTGLKLEY